MNAKHRCNNDHGHSS